MKMIKVLATEEMECITRISRIEVVSEKFRGLQNPLEHMSFVTLLECGPALR